MNAPLCVTPKQHLQEEEEKGALECSPLPKKTALPTAASDVEVSTKAESV